MSTPYRLKPGTSGLNVRTAPGTQALSLGVLAPGDILTGIGITFDGAWIYGDSAKGSGWASAAYLEEMKGYRTSFPIPNGLNEIMATYGPPGMPACQAGRATMPHPLPLSWAPSQRTRVFACHEKVAPIFTAAFQAIEDAGLWKHLRTFGGCYNYRKTRGGSKLSTHAWGCSVDLNPETNQMGTPGDMHPGVVKVFKDFGFVWGGDWKGRGKDSMHFQYAEGY